MAGALHLQAETDTPVWDAAINQQRRLWANYPLGRISAFGGKWRPAFAFMSDAVAIEKLLGSQAIVVPGLDRKGQAAFAMGAYSYTLAAGLVPLLVGFRIVPDFSLSNVAVSLEECSLTKVQRVRFALVTEAFATDRRDTGVKCVSGAELLECFSIRLENHMQPLIDHVHRATRLSHAALWRLVADYFAQLFLDAGRMFRNEHQAQSDAMRVLKRRGSSLANPQLHFVASDPQACEPPATIVSRGGCCRQYTVAGNDLCSNCVIKRG